MCVYLIFIFQYVHTAWFSVLVYCGETGSVQTQIPPFFTSGMFWLLLKLWINRYVSRQDLLVSPSAVSENSVRCVQLKHGCHFPQPTLTQVPISIQSSWTAELTADWQDQRGRYSSKAKCTSTKLQRHFTEVTLLKLPFNVDSPGSNCLTRSCSFWLCSSVWRAVNYYS